MELLDRLERRIGDLLQHNQDLRKENAQLHASAEIIAQMREENRLLTEALHKERALRGEIDHRIDRLLAGISEHEQASASSGGAGGAQ
ncbi:MAG: cell division protein ZapB [Deltaproteobacteria bacterium]|jgi:cell division septum initiation protein DivIVA|nr:cell division protein ZapB [Deltaproteobacteria bacterium]